MTAGVLARAARRAAPEAPNDPPNGTPPNDTSPNDAPPNGPRGGTPGITPDAALLYRALLDAHPEPTFFLGRGGRVREANAAYARFVGRAPDALSGVPFDALVLPEQAADARRAVARAVDGEPQSWQAEFGGPDGTVSIGHVTLAPVAVAGRVVGVQGVARDVTVYQVIEEQLQARVFTDPLTGLASRTQLLERVGRACRAAATPAAVAVLVLNLDDFKVVNDALGHAAGDLLLAAVAARLRQVTRAGDLAARLGADEFALLVDGLAAGGNAVGDATAVLERVAAALGGSFTLGGRPMIVGARLGLALWDGLASPSELVRNAGLALNRAKAAGKGRHAVYDAGMQAAARDRLELASDLRAALDAGPAGDPAAGRVFAAFQPIVDVPTGAVVKAEVLARWAHPTRGAVSPGLFIPVAEEGGLIEALGTAMLRAGCAQLRAWADAVPNESFGTAPGVTVNVSGLQIERGTLADTVRAVLAESGADPAGLTLEITESVAMRDPTRVLAALRDVTALGVRLAIDDFGTGYSSLSYLQRFPLDALKIDKSFVDGIALEGAAGAQAAGLVRAVVQMAAALGLRTVAEGVESAEQHAVLRALGCDMGQGYLFGRPGPAAAIAV